MPRGTPWRQSVVSGERKTMTDMAKVSVTFTQKVSEAPYETADYSLTIERAVPDADIAQESLALFEMAKSEVLKQAGQDFDLSDSGVVMRRLKSAVPASSSNAPSAPTQARPASKPSGPTATSVAAPPAKAGGVMSGRVYPRVEFCVGKNADNNQAAWNIIAFQPAVWSDGNGEDIKVFQVKEHADGTTDKTKKGTNYPNFSVTKEAMAYAGITVARDHGIWVNAGDSNVPLKVWDVVAGQTEADAVEWDWVARRAELQQFAYQAQ